jgi:hypothetical protein
MVKESTKNVEKKFAMDVQELAVIINQICGLNHAVDVTEEGKPLIAVMYNAENVVVLVVSIFRM